jgi:MSHA biogenesis protein MshP
MRKQQGMTLIGAIFILVIVAMLGQYLINISGIQRQSSLLTLQSARAYQTASTGIEWGAAQAINGICAASTTLNIPNNNFTTTVECTDMGSFIENVTTTNVYLIQSQSEYGVLGNPDYVSRRLEIKVLR